MNVIISLQVLQMWRMLFVVSLALVEHSFVLVLMRTWQTQWLSMPVFHCGDTDQQYLSIEMFLEDDWCVFYSHRWLICCGCCVLVIKLEWIRVSASVKMPQNTDFPFRWYMKSDKMMWKRRATCSDSWVCLCGSLLTCCCCCCKKGGFSAPDCWDWEINSRV